MAHNRGFESVGLICEFGALKESEVIVGAGAGNLS